MTGSCKMGDECLKMRENFLTRLNARSFSTSILSMKSVQSIVGSLKLYTFSTFEMNNVTGCKVKVEVGI